MNKERFLREDYKTYKPKFVLCCKDCVTDKIICNKVAQLRNKPYIRRIKIEEVDDKKSN